MNVQVEQGLTQPFALTPAGIRQSERLILTYWLIATLLGLVFLRDWLFQWNVAATLARPWMLLALVGTLVIGQVLYALVAHHGSRPIAWGPALIFAVGNGIAETIAFALVYRVGEVAGSWLALQFAPAASSVVGFTVGVIFFMIYGGLIHGLFWLKLLPPHLNDTPRARLIRRWRPLAEVALVLAWSLCFWLYRDIWSVVFFHMLVDLGLMLRVRPLLFQRPFLITPGRD